MTQDPEPISPAIHRRLAVSNFNRSWELMLAPGRTPAQDDELIHTVHASAYHWRMFGGTPANLARGENQCARVYAALNRSEAALYHATRCLELTEAGGEGFEDWDFASALEVLARAYLVAGNRKQALAAAARCREALAAVADQDDREVIAGQLAELGLGEGSRA
ncbi:MAG: hypothetical protein AB7N24_12185 [Dehalococcoidia bacterium]